MAVGRTGAVAAGAIHRFRALVGGAARLLPAALMAGDPALAAGVARLFARPFVRRPLLVRGLAALARDFALFGSIHRCKPTIFFCHDPSSPGLTGQRDPIATDMPG